PVVIAQGRVHYYEGYTMDEVTYPVRLMKGLGTHSLIITNASGTANKEFPPGDLMIVTDQINWMFNNPLAGHRINISNSKLYDDEYIALAERAAEELGINIRKGILIASTGPSYETPAEVRIMKKLGGDGICMSTVPEVLVARSLNIRVLGISCLTNYAAGLTQHTLDHSEVTEMATRIKEPFAALLFKIIELMGERC
ncbi:MAG: purine-nucleoside phosphorylase, partial [Fidelibacterota bacterium]